MKSFYQKGITLIETLIAVSILVGIMVVLVAFQVDIFNLNSFIQTGLQNQSEAKKIIRPFANEVRSASQSNLGAYPISESTPTSFSFYTDTDGDGLKEKIKYFLEDNSFKKSTIKPSGQPLEYNEEDEKIIRVVNDVVNDEIFEYYDSNYDGTASSTALTQPITNSDVRLVKVNLVIDSDLNDEISPIEITTQISIRNLKDNL
jgi:type II secretory pathway pseudopilin PulG